MIGWEKFQWVDYTPVFNLSNFSAKKEFPFLLYGSLCTVDDIWGYYVYASKLEEKDVLIIPYQGAYTYSTAQEFIRDIPKVIDI